MFRKLGFVKTLVQDLLHDASVPRFKAYAGEGFSLRRSRSFGTETVWLEYKGRGLSVEIEAVEGTDGGMMIQLDDSVELSRLDDAAKAQLAADIYVAMQASGIPCQVLEGHRVR